MPAVTSFREILADVARAIIGEMLRILENGPYGGLRKNSALRKQLLSAGAVQISQQRGAGGKFGSLGLQIIAQDYLQWLDTGRKPGGKKVPIEALLKWVRQRGLNRGKNGRFTGAASINQIAWAVQRAIWLHGIKGRHFITPAFALGAEVLDKLLDDSALDIISRDLDAQFKLFKTGK